MATRRSAVPVLSALRQRRRTSLTFLSLFAPLPLQRLPPSSPSVVQRNLVDLFVLVAFIASQISVSPFVQGGLFSTVKDEGYRL